MHDHASEEHVSDELLADYVSAKLSGDAADRVLAHVSACERCMAATLRLNDAFGIIDHWTAEAHGVAAWHARLAGALGTLERDEQDGAVAQRLRDWRRQWSSASEAVVRVGIDAVSHVSRIVTEGLEDLAREHASMQFGLVPRAMPVRGAGKAPVTISEAIAPGAMTTRIAASGEAREITLRFDDVPPGQAPPLVVLLPVETSRRPCVARPHPLPGSACWVARFEQVEPGEYYVHVEPIAGSGQ